MQVRSAAPALLHEPLASQQIPRGADGGPGDIRIPRFEPVQELVGAPGRMVAARLANQVSRGVGDAMGTLMRRAAPIAEGVSAAFVKPPEPFVAGLAADAVALAQVRHRVERQLLIPNESFSLFHGCCPARASTNLRWSPA